MMLQQNNKRMSMFSSFMFLLPVFLEIRILPHATGFVVSSIMSPHPSSSLSMVKSKRRNPITLSEFAKKVQSQQISLDDSSSNRQKQKKSKRTRKRVKNPQQKYVYNSHRMNTRGGRKDGDDNRQGVVVENGSIVLAKEMGLMNLASPLQCRDAIPGEVPKIVARVRLDSGEDGVEDGNTNLFAYIIDKPVGWVVFPGKGKKKKKKEGEKNKDNGLFLEKNKDNGLFLEKNNDKEFEMSDVFAQMTAEEIKELELDGLQSLSLSEIDFAVAEMVDEMDGEEYSEEEIDARAMELREEMMLDSHKDKDDSNLDSDEQAAEDDDAPDSSPFRSNTRPAVMTWLKEHLSATTPIRGGKYWTAASGATDPHTSGLLVLIPKDKRDAVSISSSSYVAIVGTGGKDAVSPAAARRRPRADAVVQVVCARKRYRGADPVVTARVSFDGVSTGDDVVSVVQERWMTGVRGDPCADPFDRRAARRLIHCDTVSYVGVEGEERRLELEGMPDDMDVLGKRSKTRDSLEKNEGTDAYRLFNGEGDACPGWILDRYNDYLFVQQRANMDTMPPLPPINDKTKGVYLLPSNTPNRSNSQSKPTLFAGSHYNQQLLPVQENGIHYLVDLKNNLSTGLFLDQRSQRAWLATHCTTQTRLLNCFAHCGGFTIAAATAGATTLSLDLNKAFLDRIPPQLYKNGIQQEDHWKHDAIYGDCFDWLTRLGKRGDKFDIVILDPPSTSVSYKQKKRWTVREYDQLVALAAPLVKKGGLLWTFQNCAKLHPRKFAKLCWTGLNEGARQPDGTTDWVLERVLGMPEDFPVVGVPNVSNLVWRRRK